MNKALMIFDGTNFSESVFRFACKLNEKRPILATGLFLPQENFVNLWSFAGSTAAAGSAALAIPLIEEDDAELVVENIRRFEKLCQRNGIKFRVHHHFTDFAISEIEKESRFADLVLISGELFYRDVVGGQQMFLTDAVKNAHCPVIILPENYIFPKSNILAYDGSEASTYAIKQFSYLFPELATNPTLLVFASQDPEAELPQKAYITELATQHFPDLTIYKIELDPRKFFATWISEKMESILISGSFGRSDISLFFKRSFVLEVIKEHKIPVFIAHK